MVFYPHGSAGEPNPSLYDYLSFSGIIVFLPVYLLTVSRFPDMNVAIDHIVEEECTAIPRNAVSADISRLFIRQGRCQSS